MSGLARAFFFPTSFDETGVLAVMAPPADEAPTPPALTEADLAAARAAGHAAGYRAGRDEATAATQACLADTLAALARQLDDAADAASRVAEASARALATLLLDTLATSFPALRQAHGEAELRRFVRDVLTPLRRTPQVTVHVHPDLTEAVAAEIATLRLRGRAPAIEASEALAYGDATVLWEDGAAVRDTQAAWDAVLAVLRPLGLLTDADKNAEIAGKAEDHV
jgi:flagellar biosynthesis/type III secretory pathway protein FliH